MFVVRMKQNKTIYYYGDGAFTMDIYDAARWTSEGRAVEWLHFNRRDDLEVADVDDIERQTRKTPFFDGTLRAAWKRGIFNLLRRFLKACGMDRRNP